MPVIDARLAQPATPSVSREMRGLWEESISKLQEEKDTLQRFHDEYSELSQTLTELPLTVKKKIMVRLQTKH